MFFTFLNRILLKLRKRNIVNLNFDKNSKRKIFIYYKTDPLFFNFLSNKFEHTNNSEIIYMIDILKKFGFSIVLIDRAASKNEIRRVLKYEYDIFIVNGAGNSAPYLKFVEKNIKTKIKVLYATGPEPFLNNKLTQAAYARFNSRNNLNFKQKRLVKSINLKNNFTNYDGIFYMGNKFNFDSYSKYDNVSKFKIIPSSMPALSLDIDSLKDKDPKNFLYFGGNGLIAKGLDVLLEAFDGCDKLFLDICCPYEREFWDYYKSLMQRNPNIRYHGFVKVDSNLFNKITKKCTYIIFPGVSEASATSVVTCMRRGLIPVCTKETGIDIDNFGFNLESYDINKIKRMINEVSNKQSSEIIERSIKTYISSQKFTEYGFKTSFENAILKLLISKKIF